MPPSNFHLLDLHPDVLFYIVQKLGHEDAVAFGSTCRTLQAVASSEGVWMPRCQTWAGDIDLPKWRSQAQSGKALYRLLRTFGSMVGTWSSRDLAPRGALVYVTWGSYSLVGLKVVPQCMGTSAAADMPNVSFTPLFEMMGRPDGSVQVELVSKSSESRLPVDFVWSSPARKEFRLDVFADSSEECSDDKENGSEESRRLRYTRVRLQQSLLKRGFALGPDDVSTVLPLPGDEHEQQLAINVGRLARQYLARLTSFGSSRATKQTVGTVGRSCGCRFSYQKLVMEPSETGKELAGLWTGIYGPHGLEIISVSYNDDRITATKVLGDPNVPSNEVTFHVAISSENRDVQPGLQWFAAMQASAGNREATNVVRVYKGSGRIASYNFRNPQWVPGQLLVEGSGRMSFLWEDVNFVIQFRRLDLNALYELYQSGELDKQAGWMGRAEMDL